MKTFNKIAVIAFVLFFALCLTSCNKEKQYEMNYEVSFNDGLTLNELVEKCELTNNVSLDGIEFNVESSNQEVIALVNGGFELKNIGQCIVTLKGDKTTVLATVTVLPSLKVSAFETMKEGNSQSVSVKFNPSTHSEEFTITSSDESVISVYSTNKLKAEKPGSATITVETESGLKHEIMIEVTEAIYKISYEYANEYEEFIVGDMPKEYSMSQAPIELPIIDRPGYFFYGWQINPMTDDYTVEDLVTSIPEGLKGNVVLRAIVERSRVELSYENESIIEPGQTLNLLSEVVNVPDEYKKIVWESRNTDIATVDENGKVTGISDGLAEIFAYLKDMPDVNMNIYVSVDSKANSHSTLLDYLKSIAINDIVAKKITVIAYQGNYTTYMYSGVSLYLFEELKIIEQITSASQSNRPGDIYEKHYITVHDTASGAEGANAKMHANYVNGGGEGTSWHYSVGNDGIYHQIPDNERAFHAGDGKRPYQLFDTGVTGTNKYPEVTISGDGYYVLDGKKTKVAAPKIEEENISRIATTEDINDFGIRVVLEEGKYYIGLTYYNSTYNKISNGGGNCNAIGIEMCVNKNSDIYYTWQKNAKLVAKLLAENNLTTDDVKPHHFFSGKDCPATMLHAEMWDMFIDMVSVEYKILTEYSDYKISISSSDTSFLANNGKVLKQAPLSRSVNYTITVEKDGISESITLCAVIPGRLSLQQK